MSEFDLEKEALDLALKNGLRLELKLMCDIRDFGRRCQSDLIKQIESRDEIIKKLGEALKSNKEFMLKIISQLMVDPMKLSYLLKDAEQNDFKTSEALLLIEKKDL